MMIGLFPAGKTKKQIPLKKFIWVFFICAFVVTWIGISTIQADEDDPADNMENTEVGFQNAAQQQRTKNVAIKAAFEDPEVIEAISKAKESGELDDFKTARDLFKKTVAEITREISKKRAEGEGWGDILKELGLHPRYAGLGHFKNKAKYGAYYPTQHHIKSEIKAATARSYKGDRMKGHGMSDSASNGKKFGFPKTKLAGQAYSGQNKNRGLALGHSKDKGGGHGGGRGAGNSGGRGGGKK
jgi:hypothetical protein